MKESILKDARSKFQKARELCPGMSEEVYILTDYISEHDSHDEVIPEGMVVLFALVQDDLHRGRCGFAGSDGSVPEAFLTRTNQLKAQFCYVLQVVDAIADEEFADAVREGCQQAFGWSVPKQIKVDDQLSYPPYIMAAVDWWTDAVQHPKMDNGDSAMGMFMALFGGSALAKNFTEGELSAFRATLAKGIETELAEGRDSVRLSVDYGPEGVLAEAGDAANMGGFAFPCKTTMYVSTTSVKVSAGYAAPYETIWQA